MTKPRSIEQHRRFFGLVGAAYHQWPEKHAFKPINSEHLRAWLLCQAGHRVESRVDLSGDASETARVLPIITAALLRQYCWAESCGVTLYVTAAKSIAFDKLPHREFCKLCDEVADVIAAETGLDPEALLREKAA